MDFYTLTAIKFVLGILVMIIQINIMGKYEFSVNTPLNQGQNFVLGGIIGGVIYNSSVSVLQFLILALIWSLVVISAKLLISSNKTFRRAISSQPEVIIYDGELKVANCARVGLRAEQVSRCLREENISSIRDVKVGIMEANGNLIIRQRGAQSKIPLLPIISDGQIISLGLALANKDKAWMKQQLKEQGYSSAKHIYLGELVDGKLEVVPYK